MKHIFIINPAAGKKTNIDSLISEIKTVYHNEDYEIYITTKAHEATTITETIAKTNQPVCFYSCGGDGTLNEVVKGMYRYPNAMLSIIPMGTGNDFIKTFSSINITSFKDLKQQLHGKVINADLLQVNNHICLNIASAGLDAEVAKNVKKFKGIPFLKGILAYHLSVVYCFFHSVKNMFQIEIDDKSLPLDSYIFVVAANGNYYGGGYLAAPHSKIDDGYIDVVTVKTISRFKMLTLIGKYKKGQHDKVDSSIITHQNAKSLKISSNQPFSCNIDGEIIETDQVIIKILPKQIKIKLPV